MATECAKCMADAPFDWCCKTECGQHEFCRGCQSDARGNSCPLEEDYGND